MDRAFGTPRSGPLGEPPSLLALGAALAVRQDRLPETEADVAELVQQALGRVSPWATRRDRVIAELDRHSDLYRKLATEWMAQHSQHPWETKLGGRPQIWVSRHQHRPSPERFEPARGYVGNGYLRPAGGGLWTTTAIDGWPLGWFLSRVFSSLKASEVCVWELAIAQDARVYEVKEADDFIRLVERYPAVREAVPRHETPHWTLPAPLYLPDWEHISAHWDGVRLTMFGKLRTLFVPLPVLDGYTVLINDLACEETFWMNWCLEPLARS